MKRQVSDLKRLVEAICHAGGIPNADAAMIDELKRCPTVDGVAEVLYPGELEWRREAAALADGVELPAASESELARAAEMTGVDAHAG